MSSKKVCKQYPDASITNRKHFNSIAMNPTLHTAFGYTEAVIDDDCGPARFYEVATMLASDLHVHFLTKKQDADSLLWEFDFKEQVMSLHYNVYTGISVFQQCITEPRKKEQPAVVEVAEFLESKLMVNTAKAYL